MAIKTVIITGASSGIGRDLALEFARRGYSLGLTARRYELLKELQMEIQSIHGKTIPVELRVLDVTIYRDIFRVIKELDYALGGMDVLVVNSGVARSKPLGSGNFQNDKNVLETNLIGAMATVDAGVEVLKTRKKEGQIVGISSFAGVRGFPGNASYSASKAGFTNFLEAARLELQSEGICVTTILPGFIDTPMNHHLRNRPFLIDSKKGARKICNLIERKSHVSFVPWFPWSPLYRVLKFLPDFLYLRLKDRLMRDT